MRTRWGEYTVGAAVETAGLSVRTLRYLAVIDKELAAINQGLCERACG